MFCLCYLQLYHDIQELEDQVFDVLLLWAGPFAGNPESYFRQAQDLAAEL